MLRELQIENFAVVESQTIAFTAGLNVLSGETGAGKSVVLQALEIILGARPKTSYERPGTKGWEIQALFDLTRVPPAVVAQLPDVAQGEELVLGRSFIEGRGRVHINGRIASVGLLEEISRQIINICGQNQQMKLLEPGHHRALLDSFGGNEALLERYQKAYTEFRRRSDELEQLRTTAERSAVRKVELEALVGDLEEVEIRPGLREEIEAQLVAAARREDLVSAAQQTQELLDSESGIYAQLHRLGSLYGELRALGDRAAGLRSRVEEAEEILGECERTAEQALSSIELDAEAIEAARERLSKVAQLERRYRTNSAGLAELLERSHRELQALAEPERIEQLAVELAESEKNATELADKLRAARRKASERLCRSARSELAELNMAEARLEAEFAPIAVLGPEGGDRVQFLFSPHKGAVPRPLVQIASGGELSRITLVLKKLLRDRTGVNVLVFDEVDTGVSGGVARAVGVKLKALSEESQVLCITHLPQVASLADHHLLVEREGGVSRIRELSKSARIEEIARMLAGYKVTDAARESAKELIASNS